MEKGETRGEEDDRFERFAIVLAKTLQAARSVSDSQHFDHHVWIEARIAREKAWTAFWTEMAKHVSKWGAISLLSAVCYAAYLGAKGIVLRGGG